MAKKTTPKISAQALARFNGTEDLPAYMGEDLAQQTRQDFNTLSNPPFSPLGPEERAILFAEAGQGEKERRGILDTFRAMAGPDQSMASAMRQHSSAFQNKSPRYQMGLSQEFINPNTGEWDNAEMNSFADVAGIADTYEPDYTWPYRNFDAPGPYAKKAKAAGVLPYDFMMSNLKTAWGPNKVDYANPTQIDKTYFFLPNK